MPAPSNERGSLLLAEEYFAAEDVAFIDALRGINQPKPLAGFTDRWKKDPRPWARQQIFAYLREPLNAPGHQTVVKRLFKHAEEMHDHELMAAFLVAFDRQVRRRLKTVSRWDRETRSVYEEDVLITPRDVLPLDITRHTHVPARSKLFKYRTRYYLRRRAWRYFRFLGFRDLTSYRTAVFQALTQYKDVDLEEGENILDSWGLVHACFGKHDALEIGATSISLKGNRSPGDLSPAPYFPDAWKNPEGASQLLSLVETAQSRLVRLWAMQLFQREHTAYPVQWQAIVAFLDHDDADVQRFGARLLESSAAVGTLPISAWLKLLATNNEEALQRVCDAFLKNVSGDRLELSQCIELACARPVSVARLGQAFLQARTIQTPGEREQLLELSNARCRAVAGELTTWALGFLGTRENYLGDQVIRFFDSINESVREAVWSWLVADSPGVSDPVLWSRLAETPYEDIRLRMIDFLQRATEVSGLHIEDLQHVWRSVLLGVHRGGRQKAKAVQQIAQAIIENPSSQEMLLPVLAVAVRSIRGPEARAGLAAVMTIVAAQPQLAEAIGKHLPEIKFSGVQS